MWTCINKTEAQKCFSHFIFHEDAMSRIAIADHSLSSFADPSSTDDGLLLWTGEVGTLSSSRDHCYIMVRVAKADGDLSFVGISLLTALRIEQMMCKQVIPTNPEIEDYCNADSYSPNQREYCPELVISPRG
jgi:hypothetical protein